MTTASKFVGYTTYENEDVVVLTEAEYQKNGIPEDWDEYVWIKADTKSDAYARYDECIAEYEEDNQSCRPVKDAC